MTIFQDLRYGIRVLLKSPGFLLAAMTSLALGIGANATIFTMINTVFLQPLPAEKPADLMFVYGTDNSGNKNAVLGAFLPVSYPNFVDYKEQNDVFTDLALNSFPNVVNAAVGGEKPSPINVQLVSANYFSTLGVRAVYGRTFLPDEGTDEETSSVAVLDYKYWERRFGANPAVINSTIRISGRPFTIIGVAPKGFDGTISILPPDMWTPVRSYPSVLAGAAFPGGSIEHNRRLLMFNIFGRLKPSVTMAQAQTAMQTIGKRLEQAYPNENNGRNVAMLPLIQATVPPQIRTVLLQGSVLLMAIVGLVLLIACANIANLMMARATARRREFSVRLALGGSRWRLIQPLLIESLLIALPGAALAVIVAYVGKNMIISMLPPVSNPGNQSMSIDSTVLLFTLGLALLSAVLFGVAPALRASRADLASDLKERAGTGVVGGRFNLRSALVLFQVALSVVALASAGLFIRSLGNAQTVDLGFEHDNLVTLQYNVTTNGYSEGQGRLYHRQVVERVRALPGVAAASVATTLPLTPGFQRSVFPEGQETTKNNQGVLVFTNIVAPGYFDAMRMSLIRGRDFNDADLKGQRAVVVINEAMAQRFWPNQDALGKRFRFFGAEEPRTIVGIVKTAKYVFVGEDPTPMVYSPVEQEYTPLMALIVRTTGKPEALKATVEREVRSLDPEIALTNIQTASDLLSASLTGSRVAAVLLGIFGGIALVLAAVGIYGVMSYSVNLRSQEMGIRMALGAERREVMLMVLRQGMTLVGIGLVSGLIIAAGISRLLSGLLFGVGTADVQAFAATAGVLLAVSLIANYVPARRATTFDPINVMRYE
jgi:putative ABC transport system permease protein